MWAALRTTDYAIVLSGSLRLFCNDLPIEDCVPGSCVGFLFMFANSAGGHSMRDTTLVASTPSRLLLITRQLTAQLSAERPLLDRLLLTAMVANISGEYRRLIHLHAVDDEPLTHRESGFSSIG